MLLLISSSASAFQPNELSESSHAYVETLLHASSAPIAINELINDWQGSYKSGDYAFADARLRTGVVLNGWEVAVEKRWHYDLRFSPDTAQLYYNIEHKITDKSEYKLDLTAKVLHAEGLRLAKLFHYKQFSIKPIVTFYQSDFYQLGKITAEASGDIVKEEDIAIDLDVHDYHYSEDKILESPFGGEQGTGVGFDIALHYENKDWALSVVSQDLYNRWQFNEAAFLRGEVCFRWKTSKAGCDTPNSEKYRESEIESYKTRLSSSLSTEVTYKPYGLSVNTFTQGRYQRLGIQKDWFTQVGTLGASAYSTKQLGLHWQSQWHRLGLVLDQPNWKKARHAQIDLAITVPW